MALSKDEYIDAVCKKLGRGPSHPRHDELQTYCEGQWEEFSRFSTPIRKLYVSREAIEFLIGEKWEDYEFTDGDVTEKAKQPIETLQEMLKRVQAQIDLLEKRVNQGSAVAVGQLVTTTVNPAESGRFDPADRFYRGDPLKRVPTIATKAGNA